MPTMQELADELGLSRQTVSIVVNGTGQSMGLSESTIGRVQAYLAKRGYVASHAAKRLRSARGDILGILCTGNLYSHLIKALHEITGLYNHDPRQLELMMVPPDHAIGGVRELIARGVRRLVWIQAEKASQEVEEMMPYLAHCRTIFYNDHLDQGKQWDALLSKNSIHRIGFDRRGGYGLLARHLGKLGHRRIAIDALNADYRCSPFEKTGFTVYPCNLQHLGSDALKKKFLPLLRKQKITAVCFEDDLVAARVMAKLYQIGIRIPRELSVTGFDGMDFSSLLSVPLTTLQVPMKAMIRRVIKILEEPSTSQFRHCFKMKLIKGESTAPAESNGGTER